MRILLLDVDMAVDANRSRFDSGGALYDYDIVLWNPLRSLEIYAKPGYGAGSHKGVVRLSDDQSPRLRRDLVRRRSDFSEFLKLGRTLVVFLHGDLGVYVDSGEREHSGTGRNRHTTTILKLLDIMDALPIQLNRSFGSGTQLEPANSAVGPLYRQTSDWWSYACAIEPNVDFQPLLRIKNTTKIVAAQTSYSGGTIILLPMLLTGINDDSDDADDVIEEDTDELDEGAEVDTASDDAESSEAASEEDEAAIVDQLVLNWILAFTSSEDVSWPEWVNDYRFQTEIDRAPKVLRCETEIADLERQLDTLRSAQEADQQWKLLVVGSGTPFEEAVAAALTQLGFALQPTVPGRTDLRGTVDGTSVVVETKGVTKSAAESHCAQLEKWVAEDLEEGRQSKGILVINAWLTEPPNQRTQPAFPAQMRRYAEMRNHCLVTGLQLLNLARTALAQPDRAGELAAVLLDTTGVLDGWDDPRQIFSVTPDS